MAPPTAGPVPLLAERPSLVLIPVKERLLPACLARWPLEAYLYDLGLLPTLSDCTYYIRV